MLAGPFFFASMMTPLPAQKSARINVAEWESLWTKVLAANVDEQGRIDFLAITQKHDDLDKVTAFVAAADQVSRPELFPTRQSRLAYNINAYNALAMRGVVDAGVPKSLGGLRKFSFFYLRTFTIGGKSMSLSGFENDVIRVLGDARVHFALNCMVVSCPRLPRAAFTADKIDRQLETAAREFVNKTRNVRVEPAKREVWLSAIFDFYTKDFLAHAPSLIDYVNRYRTEQIPSGFGVRFLDYDWSVNDRGRVGRR